jgi:hypothetical protein
MHVCSSKEPQPAKKFVNLSFPGARPYLSELTLTLVKPSIVSFIVHLQDSMSELLICSWPANQDCGWSEQPFSTRSLTECYIKCCRSTIYIFGLLFQSFHVFCIDPIDRRIPSVHIFKPTNFSAEYISRSAITLTSPKMSPSNKELELPISEIGTHRHER